MSPPSLGPLTVVLAAIDARSTVVESVAGFRSAIGDRGNVVLADASRDGTAELARERFPDLEILHFPSGRLAPQLWRDGMEATDTPLVAFSTAQMVPRADWLDRMLDALESTGAAGVGGPIAASPGLSATDRALYLLRYAGYAPPLPESGRFEPPGDNAIYRRDRLVGLERAWKRGFWEVEVHRALRDRGETLASAAGAAVTFRGGSKLGPAIRQRLAHARHFGAGRARGRGISHRLIRSAATPAVPPLLLARIVGQLRRRGEPIGAWAGALPKLAVLLGAWSIGESAGAWLGPSAGT